MSAHADHKEGGHKDGEYAQHREQPSDGGLARGFEDRPRARHARLHLCVNILDGYCRFVHQNAHGKGQTAQRHDVDRLARRSTEHHRREQGERNIHHDD